MAHLRRLGQLVSPTPIRPHSPAGSPSRFGAAPNPAARQRRVAADPLACCVCRERGETPRQQAAFLGCDSPDGDDEAAGAMCEELMQIFTGSPRYAPPGPTDLCFDTVQPPSRNQNPLVKDQVCVPAHLSSVFGVAAAYVPVVMSPAVCVWAEVFNGLEY